MLEFIPIFFVPNMYGDIHHDHPHEIRKFGTDLAGP